MIECFVCNQKLISGKSYLVEVGTYRSMKVPLHRAIRKVILVKYTKSLSVINKMLFVLK